MCFPANHVITRILFVREMEVFYIPSTDTPAANIPWQSVSPCCQGAKNRTFPLPAIQDSVLANAKLENITSECKKLTQLLIINPIWARTTQIRTLIQMQTRENIHDDGVGSTWKNVMVEVSLGTVGKWDDKYEWRTQSKGNELWGLKVTQEKEKSRGEKKVHWGVRSRRQNLTEDGKKSLHSLNSSVCHSLGWKSLISSLPSPREQQTSGCASESGWVSGENKNRSSGGSIFPQQKTAKLQTPLQDK